MKFTRIKPILHRVLCSYFWVACLIKREFHRLITQHPSSVFFFNYFDYCLFGFEFPSYLDVTTLIDWLIICNINVNFKKTVYSQTGTIAHKRLDSLLTILPFFSVDLACFQGYSRESVSYVTTPMDEMFPFGLDEPNFG